MKRLMPVVQFTDNLSRQTAAPPCEVEGTTVRECLDAVFHQRPSLRGYVLDDQGGVRQHVVIFLDGEAIRDRERQTDPVRVNSELFVMQALSGG
jgi:sulfur carrier protein ThiS